MNSIAAKQYGRLSSVRNLSDPEQFERFARALEKPFPPDLDVSVLRDSIDRKLSPARNLAKLQSVLADLREKREVLRKKSKEEKDMVWKEMMDAR